MRSGLTQIPVFGSPDPAIEYRPRQAAYALIKDPKGRVAAVKGHSRYFLPGGGSLPGETPEGTVHREVREELGRDVRIARRIGEAVQYFFAEGQHYRMRAVFFAAEFISEAAGAREHELHWLEPKELERAFFHQSHAWAASRS
jgi:8-oxo-dGTP pyrophosphatase MutT (NUDIX family)